jgi:hypothetical protein
MQAHRLLGPALLAAALVAAAPALAHDTWFAPQAQDVLALGTGNRYPVQETAVGREYLERQGCHTAAGTESTMQPLRHTGQALMLRPTAQARSCWAQLVPLDIELAPPLVAVYLDEIRAPAWVREAWARQQAEGRPWRERYVKHARIDLAPDAAPAPMAMDILRSVAADGSLRLQLLHEGRPLAGQALELIAENAPVGIWRHSDGQGVVAVPALPPGRWLLRGTHLRLDADGLWHSAFVTLAFEVAGGALSVAKR